MQLDELGHADIVLWLARALQGLEQLPLIAPDEPPHLGVVRLDRQAKPATRSSLREGVARLVHEFCIQFRGHPDYVEGLLALATAFGSHEAAASLAELADRPQSFDPLPLGVRQAILSALVDMRPPQPVEFWRRILQAGGAEYAPFALSGMLAANPSQAVRLLPSLPDDAQMGRAAALKLDLTWDELPPPGRFQLLQELTDILPACPAQLAQPIHVWLESKRGTSSPGQNWGLRAALRDVLGEEAKPKYVNARLRPHPSGAKAA